jgi:hypothetical protein
VIDDSVLYEFYSRATLTEAALDRAGRRPHALIEQSRADIAEALGLDLLDAENIDLISRMALVYTAIAALEGSARRFVAKVLREAHGDNWWAECVSEKIRSAAQGRQAEEEKTKWHGTRGDNPLEYTELGHLPQIMQQNWSDFEVYVRRVDWATALFASVERSRNVIMHSGVLEIEDIERLGINLRDWIKQVGA